MNAESLLFSQSQAILPDHLLAESSAQLLGMAVVGQQPPAAALATACPVQWVDTPLLGEEGGVLVETWRPAEPGRQGQFQDVRYAVSGSLLFGVVSLDETALSPAVSGETPLQQAAERAYRQIFALLEQEDCRYLWRVWNYVPEINRIEHGLERYRQFNVGRHQAFAAFERPVDASPAACALGVGPGPLSIAFLAARQPAQRIENPRQVSAFVYPAEYGPRSPTFTRAALARLGAQSLLLISGTASIVGHQTVHPGDVVAQARESMTNIAVLVAEANRLAGAALFALEALTYRVYVRHADDLARVRQSVREVIGTAATVSYVQAAICRADLLVEIEAQAFHLPA